MSQPQKTLSIDEALSYALQCLQADQSQLAYNICTQVLDIQPNNITALNLLCQLTGEGIDNAIQIINNILEKHPDAINAHTTLARILIQAEKYDNALQSCQWAITCNPNHAQAYSNLGFVLQLKGSLKESIDVYLQALELDGTNRDIYTKLEEIIPQFIEIYASRSWSPIRNDATPWFQNIPSFSARERRYQIRPIFSYDEQSDSQNTIYLTNHQIEPPIFSIVSPWGPLANNKRSYPVFLHVRNNIVEKVGYRLAIYDENGTPLPTSYLPLIPLTPQNPFVATDHSFGLYGVKHRSHIIYEPYIIVESCLQCFAHFMHDYLPYIILGHVHPLTKYSKILVASINANEERFLNYLQIPREKVVTFSELITDMGPGAAIRFSNSYLPIQLPLPVIIELIRQAFKCSDKMFDLQGRKIFISRIPGPQVTGRIENEKALSDALATIGFETIVPELLSIEEQVLLFSNARIIIGAAGSGIFSQVWAPRGTAVIIIMSQENYEFAVKETEGYQQVSACLGHSYYRLIYRSHLNTQEVAPRSCEVMYETEEGKKTSHIANLPYFCEPSEIVRAVQNILELQQRMVSC